MRPEHVAFLSSERWATMLRRDLLPWLLDELTLGDDVLEIGPGPGLTTELLRGLAPQVTAVELDPSLARPLRARMAGSNVVVIENDAKHTGFAHGRFSAVACFHVLHHVPTAAEQDALLVEAARVLRPGGALLCVDAVEHEDVRKAHQLQGETFLPLDPATVVERLRRAGFQAVQLKAAGYQLLIRATR